MSGNELKIMIENGCLEKGYSQRDLSKKIGVSHSTLNDIVNAKIKKIDVDILRRIAEELDLSLTKMLKVAGYSEVALMFEKGRTKSSRDYENLLDEFKEFKTDILVWEAKKRDKLSELMGNLRGINLHIAKIQRGIAEEDYTLDNIKDEIDKLLDDLEPLLSKYDYNKLPRE